MRNQIQYRTPLCASAPGQKWDFHTHSFALQVFKWLIVVHIFKTPLAKSSNSQHFWHVSRVESTLLERIVILLHDVEKLNL